MTRVLLTGMSGTGKSTVIAELAARGFRAIDTDYNGLSELVDAPDDEFTGLTTGQDWIWREDRIHELLSEDVDLMFLSGCASNQRTFYPYFDHIVLLTAPPPVIAHRLATRTTNPYGQHPEEITRTLHLRTTIEPLLRKSATLELDTTVPVDHLIAAILRHIDPTLARNHRSHRPKAGPRFNPSD